MITGINSISSNSPFSAFEEAQKKGIADFLGRVSEEAEQPQQMPSTEVSNQLRELEGRVHELETLLDEEYKPPLTTETPLVLLDATEVDLATIVAKVNEIITRLSKD